MDCRGQRRAGSACSLCFGLFDFLVEVFLIVSLSYQGVNGVPMCANGFILNRVVRDSCIACAHLFVLFSECDTGILGTKWKTTGDERTTGDETTTKNRGNDVGEF